MTNGENIKSTLHDFTFEEFGDTISGERYSPYCKVQFDRSWWNAECEETADCISKTETLKAIDTLDKFGYTAQYGLERLDKDDKDFVAYVKYNDVVKCIKEMTYEES